MGLGGKYLMMKVNLFLRWYYRIMLLFIGVWGGRIFLLGLLVKSIVDIYLEFKMVW